MRACDWARCLLFCMAITVTMLALASSSWAGNDQRQGQAAKSGAFDFGDAPDPNYPTLAASDGARHFWDPAIFLGVTVDYEADGQPHANALGDDNNDDDDEDGVAFPVPFYAGAPSLISVTASVDGFLSVWFDFDADGNWGDVGERIFNNRQITAGLNKLEIFIPSPAVPGKTFMRFRFSTYEMSGYSGIASNGEVEDHEVTVHEIPAGGLDFGDAPDPPFWTLYDNYGPAHVINPLVCLGATVDGETDGQPNADATGDDNDGNDDDDGVTFDSIAHPGGQLLVTVVSSVAGFLTAFFDFNTDGDWFDMGERYFSKERLSPGENHLVVNIPPDAVPGEMCTRWRLATEEYWDCYSGLSPTGEVEDYFVTIYDVSGGFDYGDAPDPAYPTLLASDGARHIIDQTLYLGAGIDDEVDGIPDAAAKGDDNTGTDDEDGVVFGSPLFPGMQNTVTVTASGSGYLNAWIDFDVNGDWNGTDEQVFIDEPLVAGQNVLTFNIPHTCMGGATFARFRFSTSQGLAVTGLAEDGEVEDHQVFIVEIPNELDYGDAPDPTYPTLLANDGARHMTVFSLFMGATMDVETDGQPDADALGDDGDGTDDEDGIIFTSPIVPGETAYLTVIASNPGYLNAWIDFEGDGSWMEPDDQIFTNQQLRGGLNALSFNVPPGAMLGSTFARFRINMNGGLTYTGLALDGEVEDYEVVIEEETREALKWSQPPLLNPESTYPHSFWGWDEISVFSDTIVADDWFCYDERPITGIRWWGSYADWDSILPPPKAPWGFHIGIWTDIPKDETDPWSHPGRMLLEWQVSRHSVGERVIGSDYLPTRMTKPDSCFQYDFSIPYPDWFIQEGDSTVYWLSIAAIYDTIPDVHLWGWKTRDRYFNDDAVRIHASSQPAPDSTYRAGEVIEPLWDLSFELLTDLPDDGYDFGDAPDPTYPTLHLSNGAEHIPWPGQYLGNAIDLEYNGLPDANALGDDGDAGDDEDGVVFTSALNPGSTAAVSVTASTAGYLNAWIDFDGDGKWNEAEERIFTDEPLIADRNVLNFSVPAQAVTTTTIARFRFSVLEGTRQTGAVVGGEVEDHEITVWPTGIEEGILPLEFKLFQNSPNPFNPMTEIRYQLPNDGHVRLSIYNISGQEIRVLVDAPVSSGVHTVIWDAEDEAGRTVPAGIYLYRIQTARHTDSKKLLLVK